METNTNFEHFSYGVITWQIKNISLLLGQSVNVTSNKFTLSGLIETTWILSIGIRQKDGEMVLYLELVDVPKNPPEKSDFKVFFKADILDACGEHAWVAERQLRWRIRDKLALRTFQLSEVDKILPQQGPDCLSIRCYLLFDSEMKPRIQQPNSHDGIKALSRQMAILPKRPVFSDIKLMRGEKCFHLHREMLLRRGSGLAALIRNYCDRRVIRLLNWDDWCLEAVFQYLYSGNLGFIYEYPRITIYELVERFGIPELKYCYPKESIKLETTVEAEECAYEFDIANFNVLEHSISSRVYQDAMRRRWQLHLMKPVHANDEEFVTLEIQLLQSSGIIHVGIEIACVDEQKSILYVKRVRKSMHPGDKHRLDLFRWGGELINKCLVNETLHLRFSVYIETGDGYSGREHVCPPHSYDFDYAMSMCHFSNSMTRIFEYPLYPDVTLCSASGGVRAHRFLLGARSIVFYKKLNAKDFNVSFPRITTRILRIFIAYLYSGLFDQDVLKLSKNLKDDVLAELYEMSATFCVPVLQQICYHYITLTPDNVWSIFEISDEKKLIKLKSQAFQILFVAGPPILKNKDWKIFKERNPELSKEILEFLNRNFKPK